MTKIGLCNLALEARSKIKSAQGNTILVISDVLAINLSFTYKPVTLFMSSTRVNKELILMILLMSDGYFIECFRYAEYVCFVFPYIQAGTLHEFIIINYPDGIPEFLASKIMKQLLEAANYLHSNNIIHNGINPSNILIDNADPVNFHILLSGTGFCKILEPGQLEDKFRGTPEYMAPEIYKHESYDINVDTWSLGITLFVLLSGRYPFPNRKRLIGNQCLIIQMN